MTSEMIRKLQKLVSTSNFKVLFVTYNDYDGKIESSNQIEIKEISDSGEIVLDPASTHNPDMVFFKHRRNLEQDSRCKISFNKTVLYCELIGIDTQNETFKVVEVPA